MKAYEALKQSQKGFETGNLYENIQVYKSRSEVSKVSVKAEYEAIMKLIDAASSFGLTKIHIHGFNSVDKKVQKMLKEDGYCVDCCRGISNIHDESTIICWEQAEQDKQGTAKTKRYYV